MITQKQIDTRDELIKLYSSRNIIILSAAELTLIKAITDADKEATGMKDEMLDALIELYHEHAAVECNSCSAGTRPNLCVATCRCIYENARHVIERATGLTIDEAIKAWEEDRK